MFTNYRNNEEGRIVRRVIVVLYRSVTLFFGSSSFQTLFQPLHVTAQTFGVVERFATPHFSSPNSRRHSQSTLPDLLSLQKDPTATRCGSRRGDWECSDSSYSGLVQVQVSRRMKRGQRVSAKVSVGVDYLYRKSNVTWVEVKKKQSRVAADAKMSFCWSDLLDFKVLPAAGGSFAALWPLLRIDHRRKPSLVAVSFTAGLSPSFAISLHWRLRRFVVTEIS